MTSGVPGNSVPVPNVNFAGMRMEIARDPVHHLKAALPPSLSGFPGEAEIRYYVKATVVRPRFYQGNHRTVWASLPLLL